MERTIWQDMIADLNLVAKMTYAEIAGVTDCAGSTIGDLATGRSQAPTGMTAVLLMRLHEEKFPKLKGSREAA